MISGDHPVASGQPVLADGRVAGFWIRVFSDLLDALILGAVGFGVATVFRGPLLAFGERAVLVGAAISLVYSGVLQSHLGGGRTLAKRLLGLRVLRIDGRYLSLDRSLVRWGTLGILGYGSAVAFTLSAVVPVFKSETLLAAFGGAQLALFLGCVLLVPFHPLKRGLHDLLTGSIVVRGGKVPVDVVGRLHNPIRDRRLVAGGVVVALLGMVAGLYFANQLAPSLQPNLKVMSEMAQLGIQNPAVVSVHGTDTTDGTGIVAAAGYLPTNPDGSPRIERAEELIIALIRKELPLAANDKIVVNLRTGINLGIYSSYEARQRIEDATPAQ